MTREPAPGARQERVAAVGVEEGREVAGGDLMDRRDELLGREGDEQHGQDQPHAASAPAGARTAGGVQPERLAQTRPPQRALLPRDEGDDEHELPDQPCRQAQQERLRGAGSARRDRSASQGATIQARKAMGSAAAAQTAAIFPREYCGSSGAAGGVATGAGVGRRLAVMVVMGRRYGRAGAPSSDEGRVRARPGDDFVSSSGMRWAGASSAGRDVPGRVRS